MARIRGDSCSEEGKIESRVLPGTFLSVFLGPGKVAGKEVVQVYVTDVKSRVEQSEKELAGFVKVELKPGETKTVDVPLHWTAFEFFDVTSGKWTREPGEFIIRAGGSSAALPLEEIIKL